MSPQPIVGLIFHAIGGMAAASFYAPLRFIRRWPWESFYLAMGGFSWLITPWAFASVTTPDLVGVILRAPVDSLVWTFLFGALWGIGAVTFGLTMRYLGMALGMSVALGLTAFFGTMIPPIFKGELQTILLQTGGRIVLLGVALCILGILVTGYAGMRKERELDGRNDETNTEFNPRKGLLVALICGLMSACFAFGLQSGGAIARCALEAGTDPLFQNNVVLCVILPGGFLTNTTWCLYLNWRNRTFTSYRSAPAGSTIGILVLCALAGMTWYFQFFFYGMGMTRMGAYDFSSWSLHMAFIIICANLWGLFFKEWSRVSGRTIAIVWVGILFLILSTTVIGWGNATAH